MRSILQTVQSPPAVAYSDCATLYESGKNQTVNKFFAMRRRPVIMRLSSISRFHVLMCLPLLLSACEPRGLSADASDEDILRHLYAQELSQTQTDALAKNFPELSRERAYRIQRLRLNTLSEEGRHVGWKLGWTRQASPEEALDPIVGHYTANRVYPQDTPVSTRYFTNGTANAEPEIVFYLNKDLPGPVVSRAELLDAIDSIGIAMEFVNWRVTEPRTREHAIADNGIAAGVVLADKRFPLNTINLADIEGKVIVNDSEISEGPAASIMGEDPLAGLLWAANELPKWGMHLGAGDFVVSGTVCPPLPVSAGDSATIEFSEMGSLSVDFVD